MCRCPAFLLSLFPLLVILSSVYFLCIEQKGWQESWCSSSRKQRYEELRKGTSLLETLWSIESNNAFVAFFLPRSHFLSFCGLCILLLDHFSCYLQHYYYLKKDYQILYIAHKLKGGNPLVYIFKGFLGCIFICLSILWFIHIAIYVLPRRPYHPFLNQFFIDLETGIPSFPLFGVLAFALFAFYLLWCVVKGNFRLGVRFLIIKVRKIHKYIVLERRAHKKDHWIVIDEL